MQPHLFRDTLFEGSDSSVNPILSPIFSLEQLLTLASIVLSLALIRLLLSAVLIEVKMSYDSMSRSEKLAPDFALIENQCLLQKV